MIFLVRLTKCFLNATESTESVDSPEVQGYNMDDYFGDENNSSFQSKRSAERSIDELDDKEGFTFYNVGVLMASHLGKKNHQNSPLVNF